MTEVVFTGSFTQQEPIEETAIEAALSVLRSGRLHRYNVVDGEESEVAALEREFAAWQGARYCLACASGGYAMHVALRAYGLQPGEPVLTNAFALSPVPGAIDHAGGRPVLVETAADLTLDLDDLERRAKTTGARMLLLSHMRGHLVDMDALITRLDRLGIACIEDCAHTMGANWGERRSGNFGVAGCFSTQTYKHMNSGEGGLLTTDDPDLMARAIVFSGSYMFHDRHGAAPDAEAFEELRHAVPNHSGRMDNLRAAILRPQLRGLERNVARWNERYRALEGGLFGADGLSLIPRPDKERYVGSSIQFLIDDARAGEAERFLAECRRRGVDLKWFGAAQPLGYTSRYDSWRHVAPEPLPATDAILARLFDLRIPLTLDLDDCRLIARIIAESRVMAHKTDGEPEGSTADTTAMSDQPESTPGVVHPIDFT